MYAHLTTVWEVRGNRKNCRQENLTVRNVRSNLAEGSAVTSETDGVCKTKGPGTAQFCALDNETLSLAMGMLTLPRVWTGLEQ